MNVEMTKGLPARGRSSLARALSGQKRNCILGNCGLWPSLRLRWLSAHRPGEARCFIRRY